MASSAQSGGSSGGPAVPTVQRGIVKMVRAGPRTRTPLSPWSGSQALTPSPSVCVHGLSSSFLCPFLTLHPLRIFTWQNPARTPLDFCLLGTLSWFGHSDFRGRGFRSPWLFTRSRSVTDFMNGDSSWIVLPIPLFLSILTCADQFAVFRAPHIFSFLEPQECLAVMKLFSFD